VFCSDDSTSDRVFVLKETASYSYFVEIVLFQINVLCFAK
jgi:hypothetical protein